MSRITDELRKWWVRKFPVMDKELHGDFTAIANRIDAEHDRALMEALSQAYNDGFDAGFASADDWLAQHEDAMAEHGWVRLPVDADGEVIHVGDKVNSDYYEDGTVTGIQFYETANGSIRTRIAVRPDGWDVATWYAPDGYRHHHAPTVEDVLREFTDAVLEWAGKSGTVAEVGTWSDVAADFAAKLRLAGDEK